MIYREEREEDIEERKRYEESFSDIHQKSAEERITELDEVLPGYFKHRGTKAQRRGDGC